jgi:uncharacterized protein (DUF433 family)
MASKPVSLRIPDEVRAEIEETAKRTKRGFSSIANEMLEEAVKMRRIPGIVFADEGDYRAVRVAGTGLEVWEVIRTYRDAGESWETLREAYHWLSDYQLRAALAYAEAYPGEIQDRLRQEDELTEEEVWRRYPFMRPPGR